MKFQDILSQTDIDIISHNLNAVDADNDVKRNLVDTVCNVVFLYRDYFGKLSVKERIETVSVVALIFDVLLDKEINPLAAEYTRKALKCFNNCVFDESKGCPLYDEMHECCALERMEKITQKRLRRRQTYIRKLLDKQKTT